MERRRLLALSGALFTGALTGCLEKPGPDGDGTETPTENGPTPDESAALTELIENTNAFAFDIFDEIGAETPDENVLASPVSISTALAMAYAGARGETRDQMRAALRYSLDGFRLHEAFAALQSELNARGGDVNEQDLPSNYEPGDNPVPFQLNLVNAVWGQAGFPFIDEYLTVLEEYYGGGFREVDYRTDAEAARVEINEWVADQTEDRIDELLPEDSLSDLTRLVLTNAIYFLANWHHPFDEANTTDESFTALDGTTDPVPVMGQSGTFPYGEVDDVKALELPYLGEDVSMLVVLPPEGAFESYVDEFDRDELARVVESLESREGYVGLPRFTFGSKFALKDTLSALGMPIAFDPQNADFSGIVDLEKTSEDLHVDDVYHDTFIAVDETGTEAAAATGVVIITESAPLEPFEFVADHPFLFAIRDRPTGAILFLGRVVDAAAAQ